MKHKKKIVPWIYIAYFFDHIARNLEPVECKLIFNLDGIEPNWQLL